MAPNKRPPFRMTAVKTREARDAAASLVVTSVNITVQQRDFLRRHGLNLSEMVRAALDSLMGATKKGDKS